MLRDIFSWQTSVYSIAFLVFKI
uniref:Uncharacterized protein n=1 Tax=Anguilla anguilla TaxID=7936 RepID=A0A0E9XAL9_ANGAN